MSCETSSGKMPVTDIWMLVTFTLSLDLSFLFLFEYPKSSNIFGVSDQLMEDSLMNENIKFDSRKCDWKSFHILVLQEILLAHRRTGPNIRQNLGELAMR